MHPIHPEPAPRGARGVTLIELVVVIVLIGIIVGATVFFVFPVRQGVDLVARAELTDIADNAMQRIGRDVRLALPNSVRVDNSTVPGSVFVEFLAVRTAGRYRADGGGGAGVNPCDIDDPSLSPSTDNDQLSFDLAAGDRCFKSIGNVPNPLSVVVGAAGDFLVLNNYGTGFTGQDAYETGSANRVRILGFDSASEATRDRFNFAAKTFVRSLHDSPGKRFFVISGPVSYACDTTARTITRYAGYAITTPQPTASLTGAPGIALIADNVTACSFDYSANVAPQVGLLTLRVTLAKTLSGGESETVSLYHAIHVSNVP